MAVNEMTEGAGLNRVLSNAFGVQGAAAPFLATEVFPVLVMGSERPEWNYLAGQGLAGGYRNDAAAGAGVFSSVGVKVASTLRTIVVVDQVEVINSTGGVLDYVLRVGRSALSDAAGKGFYRDLRYPVGAQPSADLFDYSNAVTQGNTVYRLRVPTGDSRSLQRPVILFPDSYVLVQCVTANNACQASFNWREYAAADGELRSY